MTTVKAESLLPEEMQPGHVLQDGDGNPNAYRVERILGSGGNGNVLAVELIGSGRTVAMKYARNWSAVGSFMREACLLMGKELPHVVRVYGVDHVLFPARAPLRTPVLFMDLMEGGNVLGLLRAEEQQGMAALPPRQAAKIVYQAAIGLNVSGLVHRDIKPENLLLDANGDVHVADWGGAIPLDPEVRQARGMVVGRRAVGTTSYMSPEQIVLTDDIDHRADIYCLGVTFYELLTGEQAFLRPPGMNTFEYLEHVLHTEVPVNRIKDAWAQRIVGNCVIKHRSMRYQTYDELFCALAPYV